MDTSTFLAMILRPECRFCHVRFPSRAQSGARSATRRAGVSSGGLRTNFSEVREREVFS